MTDVKMRKLSRREFIAKSVGGVFGAFAIPAIVPSHALGKSGRTPPSEISVRAVIGVGGRGTSLLRSLLQREDVRVVAVCDVDRNHLARALKVAKDAGAKCDGYTDYRYILDRDDVEVVYIATPPHWHALQCIHAAEAGKDIYCEKPMTRFIHEGRVVADTVKRYGVIFHIGTFGRYGARNLRKLIMSGLLGAPIVVNMNRHKYNWKVRQWSGRTDLTPQPIPANLDWDMWLGPAPWKPYHPHRCHGSFRGYWDYDGGGFTDMGSHYFDPVMYFLGFDVNCPGPVEVEADAPWPAHPDAVGMWGTITYKFGDGTIIRCNSGEWGKSDPPDIPWIEGPKGKVFMDGRTDPPDLFKQLERYPDPPPMLSWEEALKVRQQPGGNAEVSHRVSTILHIGNIAIRLGRKVVWDPEAEQFIGDDDANRFVNIPYRSPWHL
ncbi:MAG TPA: Gfo/Idh/MocA family oxidoreductase [Armatimonadetes bacterium]|nr:Gfo/Idh/MocA family oxidoreductase [Armatimonadota bacterium]